MRHYYLKLEIQFSLDPHLQQILWVIASTVSSAVATAVSHYHHHCCWWCYYCCWCYHRCRHNLALDRHICHLLVYFPMGRSINRVILNIAVAIQPLRPARRQAVRLREAAEGFVVEAGVIIHQPQ